jgi:membrane-associated phospholipid phosphatase
MLEQAPGATRAVTMRVGSNAHAQSAHHRPYRQLALGMVVATVVVATTWTVVVRTGITPAEEQAFRVMNSAPDALWPVLWPPMQLGTIGAPVAIAVVAGAALRRWRPAAAAVFAGSLAWATAQAVKSLGVRARPDALLADVVSREGTRGLGFVSGHAAIAAALAAALWPYLPTRFRALAVALVAAVGLARIYVGAHLPLDVLGGVAIGVLAGVAVDAVIGVPRAQRIAGDAPADDRSDATGR